MKSGTRTLWALVERVDVVGWVAIVVAVLWVLLSVFGVQVPWLTNALPQSLLFILGALAIYLHRVLEEIRRHTVEKAAELVIGNDEIYRAATRLVQESPPRARYWATSFWFYATPQGEAPGFQPYFQSVLDRLQREEEAQYLRAVSVGTAQGWEMAQKRVLELLPFPNAQVRFCFENPLVLDCLIGEKEALLGIPDRATFPHLRAGIVIRDQRMVESLRQWYQDFIWDSPVEKMEVKDQKDLEKIEEKKGWKIDNEPSDSKPNGR